MFRGFRGELFTAKKRTREIFNTCIQKHFALCTRGQTAVKEALARQQDLTMSICHYLRPVNSLPQSDGPLSSSQLAIA